VGLDLAARRPGRWLWLGYGLFFLMLFVPTSYQVVKAPILALLATVIAAEALVNDRLRLHPTVALWTLFLVSVGLSFMIRGMLAGAPGALRVGTVYVVWPLLYTLLVAGAANWAALIGLARVMIVATIAIAVYDVSYILHVVGWLPAFLYLPVNLGQAIGLYHGFIELNLFNLSSLLFLVPFLISLLMTWWDRRTAPVSRLWLWAALAGGVAIVLLSGRRALLLVVSLSPLLVLCGRGVLPRRERLANRRVLAGTVAGVVVVAAALTVYLHVLYNFSLESVWQMFLRGFDFQHDVSATARSSQLSVLLTEWAGAPLLGAGHGASAVGSIRSVEMPWAYELSYAALLFHTGLVGFIVYSAAVLWIYGMGARIVRGGGARAHYMLAVLVGLSCFLIGNATNPYLEKYDLLWVIFLPVALINQWMLTRQTGAFRGDPTIVSPAGAG
jgi:hypothetical protein